MTDTMANLGPNVPRVPGTAVYLFKDAGATPPALLANLEHHTVLHEQRAPRGRSQVSEATPTLDAARQRHVSAISAPASIRSSSATGSWRSPNVRRRSRAASRSRRPSVDPQAVTYFLGDEMVIASEIDGMHPWREHLFVAARSRRRQCRPLLRPARRPRRDGRHSRRDLSSSTPVGDTALDKKVCQGRYWAACTTSRSSRIPPQQRSPSTPCGPACSAELAEPASAASLAARVGISRQKVNYHLRALEAHGLVVLAAERQHGGITERLLQATAASYVVSPGAVSEAAVDPDSAADRLSARYLVALAGRAVREVGNLARRAAGGRQAAADDVDRHGDPLPQRRRPRRLRRRPHRRRRRPRRPLSPRRRAAAPSRRRRLSETQGATTIMTTPNVPCPLRVQHRARRSRPSRCGRRSPPVRG